MIINRKKRIVLCGSMSFYNDMVHISRFLKNHGVPTVLPDAEGLDTDMMAYDDFLYWKLNASKRHLRRIRDNQKTLAILVVNIPKHGIDGYIGPNTFAEVAVAFSHYIDIYLLYDAPEMYKEELDAWGVKSLKGNLTHLVNVYKHAISNADVPDQISLFDEMEPE